MPGTTLAVASPWGVSGPPMSGEWALGIPFAAADVGTDRCRNNTVPSDWAPNAAGHGDCDRFGKLAMRKPARGGP
jgi:hypothetical protein